MFATEVGITLGKAVDVLPDGHPLKSRITRLPEYFARAIEGTLEPGEEQAFAAEMTEVVMAARKLIQFTSDGAGQRTARRLCTGRGPSGPVGVW
jgi:uncharacterized SAM-dependent methyltransferase